jgi:hypothetical protein
MPKPVTRTVTLDLDGSALSVGVGVLSLVVGDDELEVEVVPVAGDGLSVFVSSTMTAQIPEVTRTAITNPTINAFRVDICVTSHLHI